MEIPEQQYFVGDLVMITADRWPYFKTGEIGLITLARCDKVCVKGGSINLGPLEGGPQYAMEWCYVGRFDMSKRPQGVRLDRLTPVEVISASR